MLNIGYKLFEKIYKRKYLAHHNHEIHFMSREIVDWLPSGIQSLKGGHYTPRHLQRLYFKDATVDQLHLADRIFQHILLKQIKPTFSHVMNPNCYHLCGPNGVKLATQRIRQILQEEKPNYIIRADIKSFYSSIPHYKLVQDVKRVYNDQHVIEMLERIITNPIETPRGYKNPVTGIALRGPLSQFFSGIYLKPLDDAFDKMQSFYLRYQDDIIILCKTKRQLNRCRRRMMEVLHERYLKLSRKKTRIGCIKSGFHFLGIHYPGTQTLDNTSTARSCNDLDKHQQIVSLSIIPHPRTLRKAREQVKCMVSDGISSQRIRGYLRRWAVWWVSTSEIWQYEKLLSWFIQACWETNPAADYAAGLLIHHEKAQVFMQMGLQQCLQKKHLQHFPSPTPGLIATL